MVTFFFIFYLLGKGISRDTSIHYLMGSVGILVALVVDTALFITRETYPLRDRFAFREKYEGIQGPGSRKTMGVEKKEGGAKDKDA